MYKHVRDRQRSILERPSHATLFFITITCPFSSYTDEPSVNAFDDIYIRPWTRNVTYFMGILLAYIIYKTGGKIKVPKV